MIIVLGATGTTGGEVARQLIAAGHKPRLLVRSPSKVHEFQRQAEVVPAELDRPETLAAVMKSGEKLFLVSVGANLADLESNAIEAAVTAGIKHVVKLSVIGADNPVLIFAKWHANSEKRLVESGLKWTMLRCTNFMSNSLEWAGTRRKEYSTSPRGKVGGRLSTPWTSGRSR